MRNWYMACDIFTGLWKLPNHSIIYYNIGKIAKLSLLINYVELFLFLL